MSFAAGLAESFFAATRAKGNLLATVGTWEVVSSLAAMSSTEAENASTRLVAVPTSGELCASRPYLKEVDEVSTFCNLVDIS